ncbi:hypothetical protein CVT26_005570 [Gymnopilus dilepis]|uniref:C2 domain-containing protein n=1 Tax=Gymnopilus dilepis TaxID=231916 RepID=A0A409XZV1_9AGAR|nr:hypothetical protein CVT26_005570 [Gymnopilus dilepis]
MSKPLPPSPNDKVDKEAELGTLIVVLLKARNLYDKHSFRKSDVFAQATLNAPGIPKRTAVDIKGGQHPEWDGEVRFPVMKNASAKYRKLEVACYSQEPRSEDLMGRGMIDITQTLQTGEFDDWVPLEVDGFQRGEIYLEMTYYANAPPPVNASAPNKHLLAVQNQSNGLTRRPSKLSPAERLSRPPPTRSQDQYTAQTSAVHSISGDFRSPQVQASLQHDTHKPTLDARPNAVPTSLTPTPGTGPISASKPGNSVNPVPSPLRSKAADQQSQLPLPTILRPGPPSASPPSTSSGRPIPRTQPYEHGHTRNPSSSPPSKNPYISLPQGSPPNPYLGGGSSSSNPYISGISGSTPNTAAHSQYSGYSTPPDGQSVIWRNGSVPQGPPSLPGPSLPADRQHSSYWYTQPNQPATSVGGDPYLQARYQTPLPLPAEASSGRRSSSSSPPQSTTPIPTGAHFEALKRAEDEAKRRREQELKDLELAMELDRQLNMDPSASSGDNSTANTHSGMPGGW